MSDQSSPRRPSGIDARLSPPDGPAAAAAAPPVASSDASSVRVQPSHSQRQQRRYRVGLFVSACLYTFLFVGATLGWGPMQLMLENNGAFAFTCSSNNNNSSNSSNSSSSNSSSSNGQPCRDQTAALLNVHLVAGLSQLLSPLLGDFVDRYGPRHSAYLMTALFWSGTSLLWISVRTASPHTDWILYPAFLLLIVGTWMGSLLTVQTGMYFADATTRNRVIVVLNGMFDSGAMTYLAMWAIGQSIESLTTHSLTLVIGIYWVLAILVLGSAMCFWTLAVPSNPNQSQQDGQQSQRSIVVKRRDTPQHAGQRNRTSDNDSGSWFLSSRYAIGPQSIDVLGHDLALNMQAGSSDDSDSQPSTLDHDDCIEERSIDVDVDVDIDIDTIPSGLILDRRSSRETSSVENNAGATCQPQQQAQDIACSYGSHSENNSGVEDKVKTPLRQRPPRQQLLSLPFLLLVVFFALHLAANQWIMATTRDFLAHLGDDDVDNRYLTIFTLLTPASLLGLPLVDYVLARHGMMGGFQAISLLALGHMLIRVSSTNLNVQVLGFILFSFFRCFFFGVSYSFVPVLLSDQVVGRATGIMYMTGGVGSVLNIFLARLAVQKFDGDFFVPNMVYTVLVLPCFAIICWLQRLMR